MNPAQKAAVLLETTETLRFPVPLDEITKHLGINFSEQELEPNVSGFLAVKNGIANIIVNATHHSNRKRFTHAHEIGHFVLHHKSDNELFLDKRIVTYFRKEIDASPKEEDSSIGEELRRERQANIFAANLLMPEQLVNAYIYERGLISFDELDLNRMAAAFGVSDQALTIRLSELKLISAS